MRDLKKGDRVKITGPWRAYRNTDDGPMGYGRDDVGKVDVVDEIDLRCREEMSILLESGYWWCRENLRALPRRK